jgi:DNA invertase Pin-like site-specific DNA recombinase
VELDRLGRNLRHLVNVVHDLKTRNIGFRVLTGQGASIDTTTPSDKLIFGIFASLAEFERDLISERTRAAGLASARARGRKGGRKPKMTAAKVRLAAAAMGKPETKITDLCIELGISSQTLYPSSPPQECSAMRVRTHWFVLDRVQPKLTATGNVSAGYCARFHIDI